MEYLRRVRVGAAEAEGQYLVGVDALKGIHNKLVS